MSSNDEVCRRARRNTALRFQIVDLEAELSDFIMYGRATEQTVAERETRITELRAKLKEVDLCQS